MHGEDDDLFFVDEEEGQGEEKVAFWNILIVDDEPDIHVATRMALGDFEYQGMGLNFDSAYSEEEAKEMLQKAPFCVIFLDVVMEDDHSGLNVTEFIRDTLKDSTVRIVLRTGQPGISSEEDCYLNYNISNYVKKTDMNVNTMKAIMKHELDEYVRLSWYRKEYSQIRSRLKDIEKTIENCVKIHGSCLFKNKLNGLKDLPDTLPDEK